MKLGRLPGLVGLGAVAMLLSGCATSALWEDGAFALYHEPARPPNLQLFHSARRNAVLVRYHEAYEGSDSIKPRAYWLRHKDRPVPNPHKPRFVSIKPDRELVAVPLRETDKAPLGLQSGLYAVVSTNATDFVLHSGEANLGCFELPVYRDSAGRAVQVVLTPLAVVADLTIVGGYIFLQAWASGGFQCYD